jgi:hypothetical protein
MNTDIVGSTPHSSSAIVAFVACHLFGRKGREGHYKILRLGPVELAHVDAVKLL